MSTTSPNPVSHAARRAEALGYSQPSEVFEALADHANDLESARDAAVAQSDERLRLLTAEIEASADLRRRLQQESDARAALAAENDRLRDQLEQSEASRRTLVNMELRARGAAQDYYESATDILDCFRDAAKAAGWSRCGECDGEGADWETREGRYPWSDPEPTGERLDPIDDPCFACDGLGYEVPKSAKEEN